ncbi:MAG: enoyl-CoA hydratase-related protein [Alphaproteobacteria bacterium]|jgi:2-(1,2-epoxy-1,2-dihydrophenyl)acetyl-CoA isomerase|nr:enoyl-CoA hydratase-related protein [Alphaproteobacteria bacterium]MDP6565591.1 enoyl-CoA hydratase-related protein [Alphaproteobacteria bacterium]MDP6814630.1 enoyl-CoA hydratase-related protein [Alphaproteobacteria bacterium]
MDAPQILADVSEHVGTITLNRPEAMNALHGDMREVLLAILEGFASDRRVRSVVVTGAGKAFCAGGDIAAMAERQGEEDTSGMDRTLVTVGRVLHQLRGMPQPVVAAVNGAAAGGGMNLALACDMRLGSENTLFAQSFVKIGLVPDWGGFAFLTRLVGTAKAMEIMMLGERIGAEEAHRLGLLNRLLPANGFMDQVREFAGRLAAGPPETLAAIKRGVYLGADASLAEVLAYEHRSQRTAFLSDDAREGIRAFLEKRPPRFGSGGNGG